MKKRYFLTVLLITIVFGVVGAQKASAHHTTIVCSNRDTSTWTITNSEAYTGVNYTTSAGHSGYIAGGGTATVVHNGGSLSVSGVWVNGVVNTSTGKGECYPKVVVTYPTTVPPTTVPVTTIPVTTTIVTPNTQVVPTTVPVTTTTFVPATAPEQTKWTSDCNGVTFTGGMTTLIFTIDNVLVWKGVPPATVPLQPGGYTIEVWATGGNYRYSLVIPACVVDTTVPVETTTLPPDYIPATPVVDTPDVPPNVPAPEQPQPTSELPSTGRNLNMALIALGLVIAGVLLYRFFPRYKETS